MTNPKHTPGLLEQDLCNLLSSETSILAPDDAPELARVLVENLPPEYAAAKELVESVEELLKYPLVRTAHGAPNSDHTPDWTKSVKRVEAAIANAKKRT